MDVLPEDVKDQIILELKEEIGKLKGRVIQLEMEIETYRLREMNYKPSYFEYRVTT